MTNGRVSGLMVFVFGAAALGCSDGGPINIGNTQVEGSGALRLRSELGRLRGGLHLLAGRLGPRSGGQSAWTARGP